MSALFCDSVLRSHAFRAALTAGPDILEMSDAEIDALPEIRTDDSEPVSVGSVLTAALDAFNGTAPDAGAWVDSILADLTLAPDGSPHDVPPLVDALDHLESAADLDLALADAAHSAWCENERRSGELARDLEIYGDE